MTGQERLDLVNGPGEGAGVDSEELDEEVAGAEYGQVEHVGQLVLGSSAPSMMVCLLAAGAVLAHVTRMLQCQLADEVAQRRFRHASQMRVAQSPGAGPRRGGRRPAMRSGVEGPPLMAWDLCSLHT